MLTKNNVGFLGAGLVLIGVFLPLVSIPIIGSFNYFSLSKICGSVVIALSILSLLFIRIKLYEGLWATGISTLGMLGFMYMYIDKKVEGLKEDLSNNNGIFSGLVNGLMKGISDQVNFEIGVLILIMGAVWNVNSKLNNFFKVYKFILNRA